jgi:hypothetical protein
MNKWLNGKCNYARPHGREPAFAIWEGKKKNKIGGSKLKKKNNNNNNKN